LSVNNSPHSVAICFIDDATFMIIIHHCYISPGHNFFGHHGKPSGDDPMIAIAHMECIAGKGISGDRFFDYKPDYKGQITFFDYAVYEALRKRYPEVSFPPSAFRRNVLTAGIDLNSLVGQRFRIGEVVFEGTEECRPCYWMDEAIGPGAEDALKGRGGLRAKILTSGKLTVGEVALEILESVETNACSEPRAR
jgi:MOSC domain-containing protein YiiM